MSSTGKTPEHTAYSLLPEGVDVAVAAEAAQSAQAAEAAQSTQAAEAAEAASAQAAEAAQWEGAEAAVPAKGCGRAFIVRNSTGQGYFCCSRC